MIRRLLTVCLIAAACCTAGAQKISRTNTKIDKADKQLMVKDLQSVSPTAAGGSVINRVVSKAAASFDFTYFVGNTYGMLGFGDYTEAGDEYCVGIYIPDTYAGMEIQQVYFVLYDETVLSDIKIWASAELPDEPEEADTCMAATYVYGYYDDYYSGEIFTDGTYIIPEGGCYIGYAFTVNDASSYGCLYPILYDYYNTADNSMWLRTSLVQPEWYDYGAYYGASTIGVVIYGDLVDNAAVVATETFDVSTVADTPVEVSIDITNEGSEDITSIGYTVTDVTSGEVSDIETVTVSSISTSATGTITIELDADEEATAKQKTITIVEVNGETNAAEGTTSVTGLLKTLTKIVDHIVVEEEFSTTDCGWCPRGYVALNALSELYPDDLIPIAVHYYSIGSYVDPMYCSDYYDVTITISGFPSAYMDRGDEIDPYYGSSTDYNSLDVEQDLIERMAVVPEASVGVSAYWSDTDSTSIDVTADAMFYYTGDADYALGYVLIGNGLTGSTTYWYQSNYYCYYSSYYGDDPYLSEWCSKSEKVTGLTFDHVALKATGIVEGVDESIPSTVTADEVVSHTTSFDVSDNIPSYAVSNTYLLQDKTQLEVVALLFNRTTGRIVNAAKCSVTGPYETGITNVSTSADGVTETARYSTDGRRLAAPTPGINIVKYSDGRTVKQIVK